MEQYVLLEVPEVGRVSGLWDAWVVEEPKHVGQGSSDMHLCFPDHLVREPPGMGRFANGLAVKVADISAVSFAEHLLTTEHAVACLCLAGERDDAPERISPPRFLDVL